MKHTSDWADDTVRQVSPYWHGHRAEQLKTHAGCQRRLRAIKENNHEWASAAVVNTLFYNTIAGMKHDPRSRN